MLDQQEFIDNIRKEISLNKGLLEIREVLVFFKNKGMSQSCMYECLQKLRCLENEGLILELMDFVEGFCSPGLDIYS
ncbi:hypothetical protein [Serratia fonticola]|uniref:hypothetical protein n=1 Tax=Serratia fonticola TaxID=47917 RepID=UPI00192CF848|nr:hypothetical protein [Serratia fonticola]MBL5827502.1 hypothetical protein [Serratia fonticola]